VYFKKELIRYNLAIDLNSTFKFDELPEKGLSGGLILTIKSPIQSGQHYGVDVVSDKLRYIDWIDKVQVVTDGKRPLKDLNGELCQALEYWATGRTAVDQLADRTLYGDYAIIPISWGRYLGDPLYLLDWSKYSSIELDVKNILNTTLHGSATITIENLAVMDAPAGLASKGVFQERIWREWTTVADETKYLKPPTSEKYRRIILQATPALTASTPYRRKTNFWNLMNTIKLKFLDGKEIAFDGYGLELMEKNAIEWPHEVHTGGTLLATLTGNEPVRTGIGRRRSAQVTKGEVAATLTEMNFGIYTYLDDIMTVWFDAGTNQYIYWDVFGLGYQNTLALWLDTLGPEHYLDAKAKAPIDLEVHTLNDANAAGGTNRVILSELVEK